MGDELDLHVLRTDGLAQIIDVSEHTQECKTRVGPGLRHHYCGAGCKPQPPQPDPNDAAEASRRRLRLLRGFWQGFSEGRPRGGFRRVAQGVVFTVQKALPLMGKGGSIISDPGPGMSIYGATKAALRNLVRSWILDIKGSGIRINIASPGPVNTQSLRDTFPADQVDGALSFLRDRSTIGRIGEPEEIARVVVFLASDAASYINGGELFADGGASQF